MDSTPSLPSMDTWSAAWRAADEARLGECYSADGCVLHPRKPMVLGRSAVVAFLRGGMGKLDVVFDPQERVLGADLGFERGEFRDCERESGRVVTTGQYAVTWVLRDGRWAIKCHAWNAIA